MRYLFPLLLVFLTGCSPFNQDDHRDEFKGQHYSGIHGWNLVHYWDKAVYDKIDELEKRIEKLEK